MTAAQSRQGAIIEKHPGVSKEPSKELSKDFHLAFESENPIDASEIYDIAGLYMRAAAIVSVIRYVSSYHSS